MKQNILSTLLSFLIFLMSLQLVAQRIYQPEKPGSWIKSVGISDCDKGRKVAFAKNLSVIEEWFHQNHSMFKAIKGFDAEVYFFTDCNPENYQYRPCDYGTWGDVDFWFKLFWMENGKALRWNIEPPHYSIKINSAWSGHPANYGGLDGYRVQVDEPKLEQALDKAVAKYSEFFCVFEVEREIAAGVRLYKDGNLVVFNPNRPAYWIPATVKEVMEARLNYWKIKTGDKMVYDYLQKAYSDFTPEDLNSNAYNGSEDDLVEVTAQKSGLQIMRFNPEYWDRTKPRSAVQFMTMFYKLYSEIETAEYIQNNNGHPDYPGLFMKNLDVEKLGGLLK